jgi:hypothetical protein
MCRRSIIKFGICSGVRFFQINKMPRSVRIHNSVADPGSNAFLTPGSGSRIREGKKSGSGINISDHVAESFVTIFRLKIF